jgi:hypothetical protein
MNDVEIFYNYLKEKYPEILERNPNLGLWDFDYDNEEGLLVTTHDDNDKAFDFPVDIFDEYLAKLLEQAKDTF